MSIGFAITRISSNACRSARQKNGSAGWIRFQIELVLRIDDSFSAWSQTTVHLVLFGQSCPTFSGNNLREHPNSCSTKSTYGGGVTKCADYAGFDERQDEPENHAMASTSSSRQ